MRSLDENHGYYCTPLWFTVNEFHSPQVCATATLLRQFGDSYLVTAGHVGKGLIEQCGPPFLPTRNGTIIQLQKWAGIRTDDKSEFHPDIEFIHLLDEPDSLADFLIWAEPDQDGDGSPYDYYFAVGFPASKNKRPKHVRPGMTLKIPRSTHLMCRAHPNGDAVIDSLGYDKENHVIVSFQRRSYQVAGNRVWAPHPQGMSGGALIGIRESGGVKIANLCGILTEYIEDRSAIVATRIRLVRNMLHPYRDMAFLNPVIPKRPVKNSGLLLLPNGVQIPVSDTNPTLGELIEVSRDALRDFSISHDNFGTTKYFFYVNTSRGALIDSNLDLRRRLSTLRASDSEVIELRYCKPAPQADGRILNPLFGVKTFVS